MEYKNFHRDVLVKHGVQLLGWPFRKLQSPGSMGSSLPVFVKILKSMEADEIRFELLSLEEVQRLDAEHEASIAAGDVDAPKQRKIRSDTGKRKRKTKRRDDTSGSSSEDDEEEHVTKKGRRSSRESGTAKSKEFVIDTDNE
jgi:hypothetical protein